MTANAPARAPLPTRGTPGGWHDAWDDPDDTAALRSHGEAVEWQQEEFAASERQRGTGRESPDRRSASFLPRCAGDGGNQRASGVSGIMRRMGAGIVLRRAAGCLRRNGRRPVDGLRR